MSLPSERRKRVSDARREKGGEGRRRETRKGRRGLRFRLDWLPARSVSLINGDEVQLGASLSFKLELIFIMIWLKILLLLEFTLHQFSLILCLAFGFLFYSSPCKIRFLFRLSLLCKEEDRWKKGMRESQLLCLGFEEKRNARRWMRRKRTILW